MLIHHLEGKKRDAFVNTEMLTLARNKRNKKEAQDPRKGSDQK